MGREHDNSLPPHRSGGVGQVVEIVIYSMLCYALVCIDIV